MNKKLRKAVRCYVIKDNKVVVIKYKDGNIKAGYYEIPGGKIEEGETPEQTVVREMKEETGLEVSNLINKGNIIIEYPNRIFELNVFLCKNYKGEPQEFKENISQWMEINTLLQQDKILSNVIILDRFFIKGLIDENHNFKMHIQVDESENILNVEYTLI